MQENSREIPSLLIFHNLSQSNNVLCDLQTDLQLQLFKHHPYT